MYVSSTLARREVWFAGEHYLHNDHQTIFSLDQKWDMRLFALTRMGNQYWPLEELEEDLFMMLMVQLQKKEQR